ncbi:MAG: glycosyltransferase family 9 protein [Bacteroidota bacterium]|nr:glycosyltransferase family 9 protein [Bacteroidota bacterium]MDX5429916.1 glycosyltransferase family 9 protein [Bacteroidota bacterium]MDX5468690.1 glycosyltransferase family 9 protein [Bacteroidota bacterium]
MSSILVIQTAFLGDAILGTAVLEELRAQSPNAQIDYLVRKGHEALFEDHPFIRRLLVWDKKQDKYKNLFQLLKTIRANRYDQVINLQRFAATGFLTGFSGAKERIGFNKNPFSFLFSRVVKHDYNKHEVLRNLDLIKNNGSHSATSDPKPRLYPQSRHFDKVRHYTHQPYITIAPASVWFTKQLPKVKWLELLDTIYEEMQVIFIGGPGDKALAQEIIDACDNPLLELVNLSGDLALLETAALMKGAMMNYTNDSGPLHIASAMNAPTRAVFCSTVESFGFGPLSDDSRILQTDLPLKCRPCGVHGQKSCPEGHFKCALSINMTADFS